MASKTTRWFPWKLVQLKWVIRGHSSEHRWIRLNPVKPGKLPHVQKRKRKGSTSDTTEKKGKEKKSWGKMRAWPLRNKWVVADPRDKGGRKKRRTHTDKKKYFSQPKKGKEQKIIRTGLRSRGPAGSDIWQAAAGTPLVTEGEREREREGHLVFVARCYLGRLVAHRHARVNRVAMGMFSENASGTIFYTRS